MNYTWTQADRDAALNLARQLKVTEGVDVGENVSQLSTAKLTEISRFAGNIEEIILRATQTP